MYKKLFLACLISLPLQMKPELGYPTKHTFVTSNKTKLLTAAAGFGSAALTYCSVQKLMEFLGARRVPIDIFATIRIPITQWLHLDFSNVARCTITNRNDTASTVLVAAGSLLVGSIAALLMYLYRPEGKFSVAHSALVRVMNNVAVNDLIAYEGDLLAVIDHQYVEHAYPRVVAHNELLKACQDLKQASSWLREAIVASEDPEFILVVKECLHAIEIYLEGIGASLVVIKADPNWLKQLKCYEMQKSREAQERLVTATQLASLNNHTVYYR